jgi:hypothetical protein
MAGPPCAYLVSVFTKNLHLKRDDSVDSGNQKLYLFSGFILTGLQIQHPGRDNEIALAFDTESRIVHITGTVSQVVWIC